jgi:hypothetical protein
MDNLENIVPEIPSLPSIDGIQEWITEHVFEVVLVVLFLCFIGYKYSVEDVSVSGQYKSYLDKLTDNINNLFGKFWLSSNMEGKAIKSSVRFSDEEEEDNERSDI